MSVKEGLKETDDLSTLKSKPRVKILKIVESKISDHIPIKIKMLKLGQ